MSDKIKLVSGKEVDHKSTLYWVNKIFLIVREYQFKQDFEIEENDCSSEVFATKEEAEEWLEKYKQKLNILNQTKDKALRYNEDKIGLHLVPYEAVEEIAKVLDFGAKKYAPDNWKKGLTVCKCMGSLLRHAFAYMKGEKFDKESGLSHIAHIGCNVFFILWYEIYKPELYDINNYAETNSNSI